VNQSQTETTTATGAVVDTSKLSSVSTQTPEAPSKDSLAGKGRLKVAAQDAPKAKQKDAGPADSSTAKAKKTTPEKSKAKPDTTAKNDSDSQ
jgi:hypothetical protein